MKVRAYGFHDKVAQAFIGDAAGIILFRNDVVALRQFADLCHQDGSLFARHPEHYEIVYLAEFDTETGELFPAELGPKALATAKQVMETT